MMKNGNVVKQHIINTIVFIICISVIIGGNFIMNKLSVAKADIKRNIETEWRQQAKRTLTNLQDQFTYDVRRGTVDPYNELSLQEWSKRNISGILNGGPTGDAFMINLADEKFIWDGSPDCAKPEFITNGRYMKDESSMHQDPIQAELILNKMRTSNGTVNTYERNWWNFDGSTEFLEWIIIPPGFLGFNDEPKTVGGVINTDYTKVLIALGTQQDEVEGSFESSLKTIDIVSSLMKIFVSLSIVLCVFNMIIYVFLNKGAKE